MRCARGVEEAEEVAPFSVAPRTAFEGVGVRGGGDICRYEVGVGIREILEGVVRWLRAAVALVCEVFKEREGVEMVPLG